MITLHCNYKDYGSGLLLQNLDLRLLPKVRYGLLGPNGWGKSTLLRILAKIDPEFSGFITYEPGLRVAFVAQEAQFDPGLDTISWLSTQALELRSKKQELEEALGLPENESRLDGLLQRYSACLEEYEAAGGDEAEQKALTLLEKVGLYDQAFTPASKLSGGEQGKLRLLAALDQRPDVLLLDEPGNHLDLWGLEWLEQTLENYRGTLVVVSHDRRLLERLTTRTLSLYPSGEKKQGIQDFAGPYSRWRIDRIQKAARQGMGWEADRQHLARLEKVVQRFREFARNTADPAWGKRLRAKRSQLEQAKKTATEKPRLTAKAVTIDFGSGETASHIGLEVRGHQVSRGGRVLLNPVDFFIESGQRVALIGRNGSGKTSLIDDILRLGSWEHPQIRLGPSQKLGVVAQTRKGCDLDQTVVDHFLLLSPCRREEVISYLRPYRFESKDLDTQLGDLSGGQWNLFQIARAARTGANFLILDEPTNHLDLDARENLESALESFSGTLLVVSHDRWFLGAVCNRVLEIRNCRIGETDFLSYLDDGNENDQRKREKEAEEALGQGRWSEAQKKGKALARASRSGPSSR